MAERSLITTLAMLSKDERRKLLAGLSEQEIADVKYAWRLWARPDQIPPEGDWHTFLALAGRGWGKTRAACEWIRMQVCGETPLAPGRYSRVAIVAETAADARDVLTEGQSGILAVHPKDFRPEYEPSKRRLSWPNGAVATLFNATSPDQLRGPQFDLAILDELAKWRYAQETYDMLQFGLRLGDRPKQMITTTPRPIPIIKKLLKDPGCYVVRGGTMDNAGNLASPFLQRIRDRYEGTRLGRQEILGEVLDDVPGALWTRGNLDEHRIALAPGGKRPKLPDMQRIVVGVDPAVAAVGKDASVDDDGGGLAETGIIVVGLGVDGRLYVLDDATARLSPRGWARRAISAFRFHKADSIVIEVNQGGAMCRHVLETEEPHIPIVEVHSSRGKVLRAEPVSALYERGTVSHVGAFPELEDQMTCFTSAGIIGKTLADRVDALVHACTALFPQTVFRSDEKEEAEFEDIRGRSGVTGY